MRQKKIVRDASGRYREEYVDMGKGRALPAHGKVTSPQTKLRALGFSTMSVGASQAGRMRSV